MTVGATTAVDRALLMSEFAGRNYAGLRACPSCAHVACAHDIDCDHDAALAERGYPDQASRNRARALLVNASTDTLPPPEPE